MNRIFLHPLPLRIWHWINAVIVIMLIISGLYMRVYSVAAFKPRDPVLLLHEYMGFAMIISTVFWFIYTLSGRRLRRQYRITWKDAKGIFAQIKFYLFSIFTGGENPFKSSAENKYNPLQKIAYGAIMFIFLPVQAFTGLFFMSLPTFLSGDLIGLLAAIHVIFTYILVLYLIIHIYMSTLGKTVFSHTKAMITGYEEGDSDNQEEGDMFTGNEEQMNTIKEDKSNSAPAEASPERQ